MNVSPLQIQAIRRGTTIYLRLSDERPVKLGVVEERRKERRSLDSWVIVVVISGLKHQYFNVRVLRETACHHQACSTTTDDYEIVDFFER